MSTEQVGFYEVPNAPGDRTKLLQAIENCRQAKVRIQSEQAFIKDTVKEIAKEFNIKAGDLNRVINDRAKGSFGASVAKADIYQDLYESLFPNSKAEARAELDDRDEEELEKETPAEQDPVDQLLNDAVPA